MCSSSAGIRIRAGRSTVLYCCCLHPQRPNESNRSKRKDEQKENNNMSRPSIDRESLRRSLQASLKDSLVDLCAESLVSTHAPFFATRNAFGSSIPSATFNVTPYLPRASEQSSFLQCAGLHSMLATRAPKTVPLGLTATNELLIAAAKDEYARLDQARASLLHQIVMQTSYQARIRNKLAALNASAFFAFPQTQPQLPSAQSMYRPTDNAPSEVSTKGSTLKALVALGRCPRQSTDPYIDVSSVGDQSPDVVQVSKRTRGGVIEPFPVSLQ